MFNSEKTIRKCLDSILKSYNKQVEIIVIDDCSNDKSVDIVSKEYNNILLVKNNYNMGPAYSRNIGISKAQGEYISFVDSDDNVSFDYCEKLLKYAEFDKDIIVFNFINNRKKIKNAFPKEKEKQILFLIENDLFGFTWNKLIKKEFIIKNRIEFPVSQNLCEDQKFCFDAFQATNSINYINYGLYNYIINTNSLCHRKRNIIDFEIVYKQKKDFFYDTNLIFTPKGFRILAEYCIELLYLIDFRTNNIIYKDAMFLKKYISLKKKIKYLLKKYLLKK